MTAPEKKDKAIKEKVKRLSNKVTDSLYFHKLVDWAYSACDPNKTNHIGKSELYAGLLLVHVKLAKFAGSAATFPPDRAAVEKLFDACDTNGSGGIDRDEFDIILSVTSAQIFGRILINWLTMIFVVPYYSQKIVTALGLEEGTYWESVAEQFCGLLLFILVIPVVWGKIDSETTKSAGRKAVRHREAKGTTTQESISVAIEDKNPEAKKDD